MSAMNNAPSLSAKLLANATRVPEAEYDGPVYDNGDYYADLEEMRDRYDSDDIPLPTEVWACTVRRFRLPTLETLIEREADHDHHDEITDSLDRSGDAELQAALDAWNERQLASTWDADFRRVIVLDVEATDA